MREIEKYIPLVDFLAQALGPNFEIVLHDVSNPNNSIIAIGNKHISGREVGGSVTDLALKVLKEGLSGDKNYIANYKGRLKNNNLTRSSSYFIKNAQGEIEGVLCINMDATKLLDTRQYLDNFISNFTNQENSSATPLTDTHQSHLEATVEVFENLHATIDEVLQAIIDKVLAEFPVHPERMSLKEKMEVVKKLNEHGLFLLKGGLPELAQRMKVSETTIYRYLQKIKEE